MYVVQDFVQQTCEGMREEKEEARVIDGSTLPRAVCTLSPVWLCIIPEIQSHSLGTNNC